MGWPLAVSAALMERRSRALYSALGALCFGHLLSMLLILLPFGLLLWLADWQRAIQIGASLIVFVFGIYLFFTKGHPRYLARVRPNQLVLWSFLSALAHGAGLMLVPIYLGICGLEGPFKSDPMQATVNVGTAFSVALIHSGVMIAAGGIMAATFYYIFGLKFLSKTFINLEKIWAASLTLVGVLGLAAAV
jgi:hypothetical protein